MSRLRKSAPHPANPVLAPAASTPLAATEIAPPLSGEMTEPRAQLLQSIYQVNERCIEMMVQAARKDATDSFPLVKHLQELLRGLTPLVRESAANIALLLIDMQLRNSEWWKLLQAHPTRPAPMPTTPGTFPRTSAVPLGRATLMLIWHTVRSDPAGICLLGATADVARTIASFSLTELDRVVEQRFQCVRPRWEDRPALWRALFLSAQSGDVRRAREANLRALQLMTGDLLFSGDLDRTI